MVRSVWLLLVGIVLSLALGTEAAAWPACAPDAPPSASLTAAPEPTPSTPAHEEAAPPASAEGAVHETLGVPSAEPFVAAMAHPQGAWRRSAHAHAPRGPVLEGPLRPPRVKA